MTLARPREDAYRQAALPADLRQARAILALTTPGILLANLLDLWLDQGGAASVGRLWLFGWQGTLTLATWVALSRVRTPRALDLLLLVWLSSYFAVALAFRLEQVPVVPAAAVVLLALGGYTLLPHRILFRAVPVVLLTGLDLAILAGLHQEPPATVLPVALIYAFVHLAGGWVAQDHEADRRRRHRAEVGEHAARAELERLANLDALTGALARRRWLEVAEAELARYRRHHRPFAVLMADLDRFKAVNDTHGHQAGDEVLQQFVRLLQGEQRVNDAVGRLGGEEFALLLPETDVRGAAEMAARIVSACRSAALPTSAGPLRITCSIGVAVVQEDDAVSSLLHRADLAMLAAKQGGRDRVEVAGGLAAARAPAG